jgi:2-polyprenyl-3-methyl-5-hydroxy-6-metoxy-1,4-benzoquinol methylase
MSSPAAPKLSPERIMSTLSAYQQSYALKAAIEIDLFTAIGEGANTPELLAKRVQAAERGVRILADYMTAQGFLRKENGKYLLTPEAAVFLDRRSPGCMASLASFMTNDTMMRNFAGLAASVQKGGAAFGDGDNAKPMDEFWVNFARSMAPMSGPAAAVLSQMIKAGGEKPLRVLDIAAGHGMYGVTVAKNNPQAQVTAVDWPAVLQVAKENAQAAGVGDRYATRAGSAFATDLGEGYDYVLLTNFLHHFDAATNEKLLRRFYAALKPGGKALTVEFVPNADRVSPPMAAAFSIVMLANTDAGEAFTFEEYEQMFQAAGFKNCKLYPLAEMPQQIIEAEK